jgi:hypothetical protein
MYLSFFFFFFFDKQNNLKLNFNTSENAQTPEASPSSASLIVSNINKGETQTNTINISKRSKLRQSIDRIKNKAKPELFSTTKSEVEEGGDNISRHKNESEEGDGNASQHEERRRFG